jgi:Arc/MetJ-type ribon-helix-helix transcriptional regulator
MQERRRNRSSLIRVALQYWLSAVAQKKLLTVVALADSAGLLIAANINSPEAEELAAMAPLVARSRARNEATPAFLPHVSKVIVPLRIDDCSLYLCAIGKEDASFEGVRSAEEGIRRILSAG